MKTIAIGIAAILLPLTALAAEPDPARFQLERSGDHFVRLDKHTGAMALCEEKDGSLVCRMAADERAAYDDELDRLSDRVTALENKSIVNKALPTDAEIDRSISIMERMMKSFMGMVKQFQEEEKSAPLPQKT
ncbi:MULTISPECIES: hypothetical protein [Rhizobium]|uniref:Uncharacterized protein n=3 Tax=Rhizobium TaxID=379 RepID=A0A1L5NED5_9HYPH|nr:MULTISPECIES: hypothetical protein [Rhizobium]APO66253.1 hypothetical protein IE4872_CH00592 [Rhizobium gallicum]MBB4230578.1 hypothetical protein [Rhizobium mongolense]TVZ65353.1 hypothetical protein BCL32_5655 [Rhizobium mongolense USDA 1844]ULJ71081.1 hypothetical protein L2W42_14425 [Rhizobium gallicum]WFU87683.1 hypothetical protein QA644_00825 [Rhizobium sp. CC1099]